MDNIVSAAAYIFAKDNNGEWCILCGKRSGNNPRHQGGLFDVPLGMREQGEDIANTARRETHEETGLNLPLSQFRFIEKEPWGDGIHVGSNFLVILNSCPEIGNGDWEHEGFTWMPISEVNQHRWAFGMDGVINKYYTQFVNEKERLTMSESKLRKIIRDSIIKVAFG